MAFLKRLGFYLAGLSIGLIFLSYFLKNKAQEAGVEFCYFPNCRVLKDIRSKPTVYSEEVNALISSKTLDSSDIAYFLHNGNIDFGKSETKTTPCKTYLIEGMLDNGKAFLKVINCNKKVIVESFFNELSL